MNEYAAFLSSKTRLWTGAPIQHGDLHPGLFPFQSAITTWALRKGRSAIFADCGLGKTFMLLEWARHVPGRVLILAPLCVSKQIQREAMRLDMSVGLAGTGARVETTNYERLHQIDASAYDGIVLDESSILKAYAGRTRTKLIQAFQKTPYRLCCTATPAPNDHAEYANHAEFLGICTRAEMLATWFVHDEDGWRLKGHAHRAFYRWLASWAMFLRRPSDLGFSDDGFILPPLTVSEVVTERGTPVDALFAGLGLKGIRGRLQARRASLDSRVAAALALLSPDEPMILWCGLNSEQDALRTALNGTAVSVAGQDAEEQKEERLMRFIDGTARVLISKPRIAGFGLNLQHCARMAFVGLNDSWETWYQAVRRCWRFGQRRSVEVTMLVSEEELPIVDNVRRKQRAADTTAEETIRAMADFEREELAGPAQPSYTESMVQGTGWTMHRGDCIEVMERLPAESVDLSVFSPPFIALYTYSDSARDLGNSATKAEFYQHFRHFTERLYQVMKPGRIVCCHCAQVTMTKAHDGIIGLVDLRGAFIELFTKVGFTYHGEVCIDKNPQAQAIRTHSKALLFAQLRKDASWLRPALADYVLVFRKPGDPAIPIKPDISNEDWIEWARPIWTGIRESDTLSPRIAMADDDERHVCPLQLPVIERCVRLWSNPGEVVLSPFAGIGSEGYVSLQLGRQFVGIELKTEYSDAACKNLRQAAHETQAQLRAF